MVARIYTVIEFGKTEVDTKPVYVTRVIHVAADNASFAANKWRAWATPRHDFAEVHSAFVQVVGASDVVDCVGSKSETLTEREYLQWTVSVTTAHSDAGQRFPASWRKIK